MVCVVGGGDQRACRRRWWHRRPAEAGGGGGAATTSDRLGCSAAAQPGEHITKAMYYLCLLYQGIEHA